MKRMYKFKDRHYYKTRKRLDYAEKWIKGFLETERQIAISDKVTQAMAAEAPITFKLAQLVMLPTILLSSLKKYLVWRSFKKCKKEIQLLRKELEQYE
jgi:pyridoxal/pyridoxine/pyridoxamine kinase|tara:strand:+ start:119 stop:412 length:294 start_codon:yes stop_codon:yes gene_type:complete